MKESTISVGDKVKQALTPSKGVGVVLSKDDKHPVLYQVEFKDCTGYFFAIELEPVKDGE